ncbi:hypothetical protein C8J56DRAFT_380072 [Mycena floridula]|nr:hypothetical protein C8J56DRAFT_380072 [Mycena floridula]
MPHEPSCFPRLFTRKRSSPVVSQPARVSKSEPRVELNTCCNYSFSNESDLCFNAQDALPVYSSVDEGIDVALVKIIDECLDKFDPQLRDLSLQIHGHPELMFQERFAHEILTTFMSDNGFKVTRQYMGLETAWKAEFTHGKGGQVVGINSEMDALEGLGHACGHNLIAVSGCGIALAIKAALEAHNISGKIILLGTPAEEGGGGKLLLLERGAYTEMDVCIMCHPSPGTTHSASIGPTVAMQSFEVEYFGHTAHAGSAPWEGTNALDAAFLAYSSISVLRQQIKPDHRVHGTIQGKNWTPNVIPDYANMKWLIRAPSYAELETFGLRIKNCFEAAALASSCRMKLTLGCAYRDMCQNSVLAQEFSKASAKHYGLKVYSTGTTASTDFGNVSYALPALHPAFAIPTSPNGGNHTVAFATSAATKEAHDAAMTTSKGLALTGLRVLSDDAFFHRVKADFESWRAS